MVGGPDNIQTWQQLRYQLSPEQEFKSASGNTYSGEEIQKRLEREIDQMKNGEKPWKGRRRPVPRVEDNEGNRWMRQLVNQEFYDIHADDYFQDRKFRDHKSVLSGDTPYQGWKLHITAEPENAREVVKAVNEYSQEYGKKHGTEGLPHKFIQDINSMEVMGDTQGKKLVTVYPEVDEDKRDKVLDGEEQVFSYGDIYFNDDSVNSNIKTTEEVIEGIAGKLDDKGLLYGGPEIEGHHGEEIRLGNTRIHMRYGPHSKEKYKKVEGVNPQVADTDSIIDRTGESAARNTSQDPNYVHPSNIDGLRYPKPAI